LNSLRIKSRISDYDVLFERDFSFFDKLSKLPNSICIADRNVYELYKTQIAGAFAAEKTLLLDAVEDNKNLDKVVELYEFMTRQQAKRNLVVISIGGGITQDVTGFAASTLYRGVKWIYIPTTLLAQTDSCIGSKTSLNFGSFKNLVGTFYPPSQVFINPRFLSTLKETDFFSGLGEIIKLQLMKEEYPKDIDKIVSAVERARRTPDYLLDLVQDSLQVKISYMESDEFDLGRRNLLNYGHCFGHAVETSSSYEIPHGIAVNIGIVFANALSSIRGLLDKKILICVTTQLNLPNIPLKLRLSQFDHDTLLQCMSNDKKRTGLDLTVVIPDADFRLVKVSDVTREEFSKTLEYLMKLLFPAQDAG
jgi:3-dehydroquinate synthase